MNADQINTPAELCKKVVACVRGSQVRTVADFAAGSGELLKAASPRFASATFIALDIDPRIVRRLRKEQPRWIVSRGDFLNQKARAQCAALRRAETGIDLILLNPPFSSRGGSRWQVPIGREVLFCSRAAAFVVSSLQFLSAGGEIVSIIPAGSLKSEKDRIAWELLRETFSVSIMGTNGHDTFDGCSAHTVIVHLARRARAAALMKPSPKQLERGSPRLELYRGSLQMHELRKEEGRTEVPLVHSTCLRNGLVDFAQLRASNSRFKIRGPALFLVRVGEPKQDKVVLYRGREEFAMSDCVIAVKARGRDLASVHQMLMLHWRALWRLYRGTGAKYITIDELATFFGLHGFAVKTQLKQRSGGRTGGVSDEIRGQWRASILRGEKKCD